MGTARIADRAASGLRGQLQLRLPPAALVQQALVVGVGPGVLELGDGLLEGGAGLRGVDVARARGLGDEKGDPLPEDLEEAPPDGEPLLPAAGPTEIDPDEAAPEERDQGGMAGQDPDLPVVGGTDEGARLP